MCIRDSNTPPTAIFSTNYNITLGLITSARERGIVIPDQVSVFGYDSVDVCQMCIRDSHRSVARSCHSSQGGVVQR